MAFMEKRDTLMYKKVLDVTLDGLLAAGVVPRAANTSTLHSAHRRTALRVSLNSFTRRPVQKLEAEIARVNTITKAAQKYPADALEKSPKLQSLRGVRRCELARQFGRGSWCEESEALSCIGKNRSSRLRVIFMPNGSSL